jgi:exodeoxyribonuclease VII large subunit
VVRAAAACTIPLISAVGHETDTTLIDHAADRRAPTPTAAAELAVPSRTDLAADLQQKAARLAGAVGRVVQTQRLRLDRAERGLPDLAGVLGAARQRLDDRAARLALALPNLARRWRARLVDVERHLVAPAALIAARRADLALLSSRQTAALRHAIAARPLPRLSDAPLHARLREARARLEGLAARLDSVSHRAVLARGYAAVFADTPGAAGEPLTSAAAVKPGAALRIEFADGSVRATAARGDRRQGALPL